MKNLLLTIASLILNIIILGIFFNIPYIGYVTLVGTFFSYVNTFFNITKNLHKKVTITTISACFLNRILLRKKFTKGELYHEYVHYYYKDTYISFFIIILVAMLIEHQYCNLATFVFISWNYFYESRADLISLIRSKKKKNKTEDYIIHFLKEEMNNTLEEIMKSKKIIKKINSFLLLGELMHPPIYFRIKILNMIEKRYPI